MNGPPRLVRGVVFGLAAVGLVLGTLGPFHERLQGAAGVLLVLPVVAAGLLGGLRAALITAVGATVAYLVGFIPPVGSLRIDLPRDLAVLVTFSAVATAVGALVAVSDRRRREAEAGMVELAAAHERLVAAEAERALLAVEAERAVALTEIDRQRRALLRTVSHDLRTPLVTIRGVATDLVDGAPVDEDTRHRLLSLVAKEAGRLDRMVSNLLDMSRIEAGALRPVLAAVDVQDVVTTSVERLEVALSSVAVHVDVAESLPMVLGDFGQLAQVVGNLVDNAVRHTPPHGVIEVGAIDAGQFVRVVVRDHGPGVGSASERLFVPFVGDDAGHTGLGLAICRAIVQAHGGTIEAHDADGGGAEFCFTVPVAVGGDDPGGRG